MPSNELQFSENNHQQPQAQYLTTAPINNYVFVNSGFASQNDGCQEANDIRVISEEKFSI